MMDGGMMDGGVSSHRKFAAPIGLGLRAPIQIMSGPDDLARMIWPGWFGRDGLVGVAFFGDADHLIRT
jgi:hypothetical protein